MHLMSNDFISILFNRYLLSISCVAGTNYSFVQQIYTEYHLLF